MKHRHHFERWRRTAGIHRKLFSQPHRLLLVAVLLLAINTIALAQNPPESTDAEAAYTRTIRERAERIVSSLELNNTNQAVRVGDIITRQYRDLRRIHDERDARIAAARDQAGADRTATEAASAAAREDAQARLDPLHGEFLARLAAELSPEQVDRVKDGLTYGVLAVTYNTYLKMYPNLTAEQQQQIMAWLVEARELAMDQGTAREKHAVFNKYKGRINNYLSRAGYDAKEAEKNLRRADPPPLEAKPTTP